MTPAAPRITVGIAAYNAGELIETALGSVLAQDCADSCEIIVLDDASTDDTAERARSVLRHAGSAHRVIVMDENQVSLGRSPLFALARLARAPFLARLDADDYWLTPDKLRCQLQLLEANPAVALCCTGFEIVGDPRRAGETHPVGATRSMAPLVPAQVLRQGNFIAHSSVCVRVDAVRELGDLGGWQRLAAGDYAAWGYITRGRFVGLVPEPMTAYRVHPGNVWMGRSLAERSRDELDALLWLAKFSPDQLDRAAWSHEATMRVERLLEDGPAARLARENALQAERRLSTLRDILATARNERAEAIRGLQDARFRAAAASRDLGRALAEKQALAEQLRGITVSRGYRVLEFARRFMRRTT
jgi:glycosyltransferase involved in cell wall biosynthesis